MNAPKLLAFSIFAISVFVLSACSTNPKSSNAIQASGESTEIPLSVIETKLITPGDLPAGFSGAQIRNSHYVSVDVKPEYQVFQQFESNGKEMGGVEVIVMSTIPYAERLFDSLAQDITPIDNEDYVIAADVSPGVGEIGSEVKAVIIVGGPDSNWRDGGTMVVRQCKAVFLFHMHTITGADALSAYGTRLAERLEPIVCQAN